MKKELVACLESALDYLWMATKTVECSDDDAEEIQMNRENIERIMLKYRAKQLIRKGVRK